MLDERSHVANSDFRAPERRIAYKSVDQRASNKIDV